MVSLLTPNPGFNARGFDVWVPKDPDDLSLGQTPIPLDPDFLVPLGDRAGGTEPPYQTFAFEYTVGNDHYDLVTIDFNDGNGPQEVRTEDNGSLVPIGQPAITAQGVDGFVFTDTGWKQASYMFDNIFIEILSAALPGDANNDGLVTGADLISVQQNFGKTGDPGLPGDANNDGLVTGADLISVQQNFGKAATAPVPEAAAIAMLFLMGGLIVRHRTA